MIQQKVARIFTILSLITTAITLIGLQQRPEGWIVFAVGCISLFFAERGFRRDISLVFFSLAILGFIPITTDTSLSNMFLMGTALIIAVVVPYIVSRFIYRQNTISYGAFSTRRWTQSEWLWIGFTLILGYFLIPYYLADTLSYENWTVKPGAWELMLLFIGTNALGIWDELFFVNTVLAILRRHFDFHIANIVQATLFTSFLYELGFRGWGPCVIFPFALAQGYVFRSTKNLTYIISLHLALDLILYLALIHLHHPDWWVRVLF